MPTSRSDCPDMWKHTVSDRLCQAPFFFFFKQPFMGTTKSKTMNAFEGRKSVSLSPFVGVIAPLLSMTASFSSFINHSIIQSFFCLLSRSDNKVVRTSNFLAYSCLKQSSPGFLLSCHFLQHVPWGSQGVPRPDKIYNVSSMLRVHPWVSSQMDMPGIPLQGRCQGRSLIRWQNHLNWLLLIRRNDSSTLFPDIQAPHPAP